MEIQSPSSGFFFFNAVGTDGSFIRPSFGDDLHRHLTAPRSGRAEEHARFPVGPLFSPTSASGAGWPAPDAAPVQPPLRSLRTSSSDGR